MHDRKCPSECEARGAKTPPGQVDAVDFSPPARSRGSERAPLSPISAAITRACQHSPPAHLNPLGPPTRARQPSPPLFSSSSRHALPLPQLPPTTTTLPPQAPQPKTPQSFDICRAALAAPHAFLHPPLPLAETQHTRRQHAPCQEGRPEGRSRRAPSHARRPHHGPQPLLCAATYASAAHPALWCSVPACHSSVWWPPSHACCASHRRLRAVRPRPGQCKCRALACSITLQ